MLPKLSTPDHPGKPFKYRKWQAEAFEMVANMIGNDLQRASLVNACPGAGKTTLGVALAKWGIDESIFDYVVVVSPRAKIRNQWKESMTDLASIKLKNRMTTHDFAVRNAQGGSLKKAKGVSITYAMLNYPEVRDFITGLCSRHNVLVILDEVHWNAEGKSWGAALVKSTRHARFRLALSGTPFREDHYKIPLIEYVDGEGQADYDISYGRALEDHIVRPVEFYHQTGAVHFRYQDEQGIEHAETLDFEDGDYSDENGGKPDDARMNRRLSVAMKPQSPFWQDIVDRAHQKVMEQRESTHPNAGGIVFCVDQAHARAVAAYFAKKHGINPQVITTSESPNAESAIDTFAESDAPWVVSVRMITEGVDIPRLRVAAFLTNVTTRRNFMQSIARTIRQYSESGLAWNEQNAFVFMPDDPRLAEWAIRFKEAVRDVLQVPPEAGAGAAGGDREKRVYEVDDAATAEDGATFGGEYFSQPEIEDAVNLLGNTPELAAARAKLSDVEWAALLASQAIREQRG